MNRRRPTHGFTLIEILIVVAIIGILASVAIPELGRASLRAKSAERRSIMNAIAKVMTDVALNQNGIPGHTLTGASNPPLPLSTGKRPFNRAMAGWNQLPLTIEGDTYYSYAFEAEDGTVNADGSTTLDITAQGDLDGDGNPSPKLISYVGLGHAFVEVLRNPEDGAEDQGTF